MHWPEVVPLKSVMAKTVAEAVIGIFGHTSLPLLIISDNGAQFTGKFMIDLTNLLRVDRVKTMPYHPQTNEIIERMYLRGNVEVGICSAKRLGSSNIFCTFSS